MAAILSVCPVRADVPAVDWARLVAIAKCHDLPMPGPQAKLALLHQGWTMVGGQSGPDDSANYTPGWVLETLPDGGLNVLIGAATKTLKPRKASEPLERLFSVELLEPKPGSHAVRFSEVSVFVTAVQCAARGDLQRAKLLWERFCQADRIVEDAGSMRYSEGRDQPDELLAAILFDRLELQIATEAPDLKVIERRMGLLIAECPKLEDERRRRLIESLKLTNEAPPAAEGSVESLLIAAGRYDKEAQGKPTENPNRTKVLHMGFDAIPALLRLRNDRRVTSLRHPFFMNSSSSPKCLGDLADEILRQLLPPFEQPSIMGRHASVPDYKAEWNKARQSPEADYYARAAFIRTKKKSISETKSGPLSVLAQKYPQRLPGLFRAFLKEAAPDASAGSLLNALVDSALPETDKLALLTELAGTGNLENRTWAVRTIGGINAGAAVPLALQVVKSTPRDAKGPYWTSPESGISHLVLATDDDAVWQEFLLAARKASVGLRLEWMDPFAYRYVGERLKGRRLAFLASFLEDRSIRDDSKTPSKFDGPCAAFTFPKISVRNFVAMQIASILDLDPLNPPDSSWNEARWTELRVKVWLRLEADGVRMMEVR